MKTFLLTLLAMFLGLSTPASAIDSVKPLGKLRCDLAMASNKYAALDLDLEQTPKLLQAVSDGWRVDTSKIEKMGYEDSKNRDLLVARFSDNSTQIIVVFPRNIPGPKDHYLVELFDSRGGQPSLLFGIGYCQELRDKEIASRAPVAALNALLRNRPEAEVGKCLALTASKRGTFFARPQENFQFALEPLTGSLWPAPITVTKIDNGGQLPDQDARFEPVRSIWLTSAAMTDRGSFERYDRSEDWMMAIRLWKISGRDGDDAYLVSHCGGQIK